MNIISSDFYLSALISILAFVLKKSILLLIAFRIKKEPRKSLL